MFNLSPSRRTERIGVIFKELMNQTVLKGWKIPIRKI